MIKRTAYWVSLVAAILGAVTVRFPIQKSSDGFIVTLLVCLVVATGAYFYGMKEILDGNRMLFWLKTALVGLPLIFVFYWLLVFAVFM